MTCIRFANLLLLPAFCGLSLAAAQPTPAAVAAFNSYAGSVEARLARQHRAPSEFLAPLTSEQQSELRRGELVIEDLTPAQGAELTGRCCTTGGARPLLREPRPRISNG